MRTVEKHTTQRLSHYRALELVDELTEILSPFCERIEVAGSVRRGLNEVKDVEFLMAPKLVPLFDLFDSPAGYDNPLWDEIQRLERLGVFSKRPDENGAPRFGERTQYLYYFPVDRNSRDGRREPLPIALDLFSVLPPAQWGWRFIQATGPADFNIRLVTHKPQGWLPANCKFREGQLHVNGRPVPTPEEQDVFKHLGIPYIRPEDRR